MRFAANYSHKLAQLVRSGDVLIDYFKCPAWLDLLGDALALRPTYVHFPLRTGRDGIYDTEANAPVDWHKVEQMLETTNTLFINIHFLPRADEYPEIPLDSDQFHHAEMLVEDAVRHIEDVTKRFGKEQVIVENVPDGFNRNLHLIMQPNIIQQVIEEADCGFLFDISHAQLASILFNTDVKAYINQLPVKRIKEIHITGLQFIDENTMKLMQKFGIDDETIERSAGRTVDHMPMTEADWVFFDWCLEHIRMGKWQAPEIVAFEYGGVGAMWEAITVTDILQEQIPRLHKVVTG